MSNNTPDALTEIYILKRNVAALHSALKLQVEDINGLRSSIDSLQGQMATLLAQNQILNQTVTVLKVKSFGHGPTS